jgi:two-component system, NarL family, response regulator LiaR
MIKVIVVDDSEPVRVGLSVWLGLQPDLEVVGEADNGAAALDLALDLCPDVVVMDVKMPICDGVTATARMRDACPNSRVLLLSFDDDPATIEAGLAAGAAGYVLKYAGPDAVTAGVRAVYRPVEPQVGGSVPSQSG